MTNNENTLITITPQDLAGDYASIAEIIGMENAKLLYEHYRGQQITFPQCFYSKNYVALQATNELKKGNCTLSQLAVKYGYTERRLRQLIKEFT